MIRRTSPLLPERPGHRLSVGVIRMATTDATVRRDFDRIGELSCCAWDNNVAYHNWLLRRVPERCTTVLDLGCGLGGFTRRLSPWADRVIGLDLSPVMIERARMYSSECRNVEFIVADALEWAWPEGELDCVISIATLHHIPLQQILPLVAKAIRPGGVFIVLDLLACKGVRDLLRNSMAWPVARVLATVHGTRASQLLKSAWAEHASHEELRSLTDVRRAWRDLLPRAKVKRRLLWRYSAVWHSEASP